MGFWSALTGIYNINLAMLALNFFFNLSLFFQPSILPPLFFNLESAFNVPNARR